MTALPILDTSHTQRFIARSFKFAIVGASGVVVNFLTLILLHEGLDFPLLVAVPVAVETAIINNFVWNDSWTFRERKTSSFGFLKFNASCLGGLLISTASVYALVTVLGLHYVAANLMAIGLASSWNFCFSNLWAWSEGRIA